MLKEQYDVTLITGHPIAISELNSFYSTSLRDNEISVCVVPLPHYLGVLNRFAALRWYRVLRYSKKNSSNYDLMFSSFGLMDFGKKGIQYLLDPNFNERLLKMLNPSPRKWKRWFYKDTVFRKFYLNLADKMKNYSVEGMKKNVTLVDSNWTGALAQSIFGLETITVYPPVLAKYPYVPWGEREDGFICMGRIVPEKQIERTIEIIGKLRLVFPKIHLHIMGKIGDRAYGNYLKALISENKRWLFLEGDVGWEQKTELLSKHKYGIHGKENEPFGIVIAEMASAGCLVWVPNSGGQIEIVNHQLLTYANADEAVNKISRVIQDIDLQDKIRTHLSKQSKIFTVTKYQSDIRRVVIQALAK